MSGELAVTAVTAYTHERSPHSVAAHVADPLTFRIPLKTIIFSNV